MTEAIMMQILAFRTTLPPVFTMIQAQVLIMMHGGTR